MPKKTGKRGPRPEERQTRKSKSKTNGQEAGAPQPLVEYFCKGKKCEYHTLNLDEMVEHINGTEHEGYRAEEKQAQLYTEPTPISRRLKVPISGEELHQREHAAAEIVMKLVEQREIVIVSKERIKALEADQNDIVAKLRDPYKLADVTCQWQINLAENSKSLCRVDTNEVLETKALSAEDRANEEARVKAMNEQPKTLLPETPAPPMEQTA